MSNIYEQKAKKYKYKYLKLKNEYFGVGGNYLGEGAYGCIISPPFQFVFNDNKQIIYQSQIDNNIYNENYVAKLLKSNDMYENKYINSFYDEYEEFIKLDKIDPESKHRSKIVFAAYINNEQYLNIDKEYKKKSNPLIFINCLNTKINRQLHITNIANDKEKGKSYKFGYIISTKVGKSFDKVKLNNYNINDIINILTNFNESIKDLITTLYKQNLIHADIKFQNMTLDTDNNFKVCFIDFGLMKNYSDDADIEKLKNISQYYLYPDILYTYFHIIKRKNKSSQMTKLELIRLLKLYENLKQQFNNYNPTLLNITKLQKINYSHFFKSLEDNVPYSLYDIEEKCIKPIIKNIDIYGLSLFIYELFFNFNRHPNPNIFNPQYREPVGLIIQMILINAIYNNIDGPEELIYYLDGIINSLNGSYKNGYIKKKIYERRLQKINKPYINYYYNGYSVKWVEGIEEIIPYTQTQTQTQNYQLAPARGFNIREKVQNYEQVYAPARGFNIREEVYALAPAQGFDIREKVYALAPARGFNIREEVYAPAQGFDIREQVYALAPVRKPASAQPYYR